MSTLRNELTKLNELGVEAIREELTGLDHWDRRSENLSRYLAKRIQNTVAIYGNTVHETQPTNRLLNTSVCKENLSQFPAVRAYLLREDELVA